MGNLAILIIYAYCLLNIQARRDDRVDRIEFLNANPSILTPKKEMLHIF